jgi:neutral ceramidase
MGNFRGGAAEINITPPIGVSLCGFGGRKGPADNIFDDLYARALVIEEGEVSVCIVTSDVISFAPDLVQRIRDMVARDTGIRGSNLVLSASHSHSGPTVMSFRSMGSRDQNYEDMLCRKVLSVVRMAQDRVEDVSLSTGRAPVEIAHNRREFRKGKMYLGHNPGGPQAPWVDVLRIDRADGSTLGLLYATAAHPVNLRGLDFSAEFPGYAAKFLKENIDGVVPMFAQGCCGDINCTPMDGSLATTRRQGQLLGSAALTASLHAEPLGEGHLASDLRTLNLPFIIPSVEEAEQAVAVQKEMVAKAEENAESTDYLIRQYKGQIEWAEEYLRIAESGVAEAQEFEIQTLCIGEWALVAYPGEMFVDYQLTLDKDSPFLRTVTLGYSNGCIGYVPTANAYPEGGYEVSGAFKYYGTLMINSDCESMIKTETVEMLQALKG